MKKSTKKLIVIFCACGLLAAAGVFAALWSTRLSPPKNLAVSDTGILTWDGCKNASLYVVNIDGEEYETDSTQLDIFFITDRYKDYNITVTAYPSLRSTKKPKTSELFTYEIEGLPDNYEKFKLNDDGKSYSFYLDDSAQTLGERTVKKIIVPSVYGGLPVTSVVGGAFFRVGSVTTVLLPDSVYFIGNRAFGGCYDLKRINVPAGVTVIESETFAYCYALEEIILHEGITDIKEMAFKSCKSLKSINLPESLINVGFGAFASTNLGEVIIPQSVQTIGGGAFGGKNLSIILPSTVKTIGQGAFYGTVYTDATEIPVGWYTSYDTMWGHPILDATDSFITGKLFLNCKLNYEGEDVYVESLTYTDIPDMHQWMPYNSEPVRHGYTFKGWATERDGTAVYTMEQLLSYTGDGWPDDPKADKTPVVPYGTTLYPVWESA